jgi:hypothetical protein
VEAYNILDEAHGIIQNVAYWNGDIEAAGKRLTELAGKTRTLAIEADWANWMTEALTVARIVEVAVEKARKEGYEAGCADNDPEY